jgi:phosphatidate phosphatase APP1
MAYPGIGYPINGDQWRVHISGIVWNEPVVFSMRQRMMIRMLGGVMKATPDDLKGETFQGRITPFMAEADHRESIIAEVNGRSFRLKKKTKKNGHFKDSFSIDAAVVEQAAEVDESGNRILRFAVNAEDPKSNQANGLIYLLNRTGVSVVSDIDDTIKDSSVGDRKELLNNTFLRDFRSVEGMAAVYQDWAKKGASFHYVSSSPWQLFSSLQQMNVSHEFPLGTMHLRNFRLRDQLLKKVIIRRHGKTTAIRALMKNLPDRKFVLIGDSGEKDPQIYRKICRKFPDRVKALFIRNLPHRPLEQEQRRKLVEAIPSGVFGDFEKASELKALSDGLFD